MFIWIYVDGIYQAVNYKIKNKFDQFLKKMTCLRSALQSLGLNSGVKWSLLTSMAPSLGLNVSCVR